MTGDDVHLTFNQNSLVFRFDSGFSFMDAIERPRFIVERRLRSVDLFSAGVFGFNQHASGKTYDVAVHIANREHDTASKAIVKSATRLDVGAVSFNREPDRQQIIIGVTFLY